MVHDRFLQTWIETAAAASLAGQAGRAFHVKAGSSWTGDAGLQGGLHVAFTRFWVHKDIHN